MGLFKKAKDQGPQAPAPPSQPNMYTQAMDINRLTQQNLMAGMTDATTDPNDPAFAPIEGVDLEGYTKAQAAIFNAGVSSDEDVAKVAEANGIPAGKWKAVSDGWLARMRTSVAVRNRYGSLFGRS